MGWSSYLSFTSDSITEAFIRKFIGCELTVIKIEADRKLTTDLKSRYLFSCQNNTSGLLSPPEFKFMSEIVANFRDTCCRAHNFGFIESHMFGVRKHKVNFCVVCATGSSEHNTQKNKLMNCVTVRYLLRFFHTWHHVRVYLRLRNILIFDNVPFCARKAYSIKPYSSVNTSFGKNAVSSNETRRWSNSIAFATLITGFFVPWLRDQRSGDTLFGNHRIRNWHGVHGHYARSLRHVYLVRMARAVHHCTRVTASILPDHVISRCLYMVTQSQTHSLTHTFPGLLGQYMLTRIKKSTRQA